MKNIPFLILGILFSIVLAKGEVISWFRIQEMFRFDSFHMYGVIGSAVILEIVFLQILKKLNLKNRLGEDIIPQPKDKNVKQYIIGGSIFGMGWAITGACPGPIYTLVGYGYLSYFVIFVFAVVGTYFYGRIAHKLPH